MHKFDVVVIGSGVAGLSFAIQLAKEKNDCQIAVLSKSRLHFSNTYFAQGGIAAVTNLEQDSFQEHFDDTMSSGARLSRPSIVKFVVEAGPRRIQDLVKYGVAFNHTPTGAFDLALEGGHSKARVVHSFDHTGANVQEAFLKTAKTLPNIHFFEHYFSAELLHAAAKKVRGVTAINLQANTIEYFNSKVVILATGGSGQVFQNTTNPFVATGDGLAMALRIGAKTSHLNFVQFHPTALFEEGKTRLDLLTEAIRGFGAYIVNNKGERFLFQTDKRGELATRDIVSRAIFHEIKKSGAPAVFLDCRHLDSELFGQTFPQVTANLKAKNYTVSKDLIPIVPAAHYQCGGITVNEKSQTSLENLYAIGEVADTGLHGANRLASNSLLEGLVFGYDTAEWIANNIDEIEFDTGFQLPARQLSKRNDAAYKDIIQEVKSTMSQYATIITDDYSLVAAQIKLKNIEAQLTALNHEEEISELHLIANNLTLIAQEIVQQKGIQNRNQKIINHEKNN